jgi:hypothetical protein
VIGVMDVAASSRSRRLWKVVGRWIGSLGNRSRGRTFEVVVAKAAAKADLDLKLLRKFRAEQRCISS